MKVKVALLTLAIMWTSVFVQNIAVFFCCTVLLVVIMGLAIDRIDAKLRMRAVIVYANVVLSNHVGKKQMKISTSTNNKIIRLAKPILKQGIMLAIQKKMSLQIQHRIASSGRAQNPRILAQKSLSYTLLSFPVAVPLSVILGLYVNPTLFLLTILPLTWIAYPMARLKFDVSERKTAINDELAFFTLYASVMQSVGQHLYQSITDIAGKSMFPGIEREARMLWRNIRLFGIDQQTALNTHAISHPNPNFRNLLLGYVSISKSGGDLGAYMEAKAQEFFRMMQFKHSAYRSNANIIGESMLILLAILPILALMSSFLFADGSIMSLMGLSLIVVPVITASIIAIINLSQPKNYDVIEFDIKSVVIGGMAAIVFLILGQPIWLTIGAGLAAGSAYGFLFCFRQIREISLTDAALPDFFRDVTEYRKIGIPIQNAVIKISEGRTYNRHFDTLLRKITSSLRYGYDLSDILRSMVIRSWTVRTSLFVLGKIASSGGGTAQILEQITAFSSDIYQTKRDTQASVNVISYFALASPLLMSYTSGEMLKILQKLNSGINPIIQGAFNMEAAFVGNEITDIIGLLIVVSGASLGLVLSKLVNFTIKHTLFLLASVAVSIISILLSPYMPSLIQI